MPDGSTTTGPLPESRVPYRGLRTFNEEDAPFFFGRTDEIQSLAAQLEKTCFLAVVGASGSGKSSLVRAGLIPNLRKGILPDSGVWRFYTFTPGPHPLESLAIGLSSIGLEKQMSRMMDEMKEDAREFYLNTQLAFAQQPTEKRIVWIVDQFEEAFTLCKEESEQASFINNLLYASKVKNGRSIILITIRADFYHKCLTHPELARAIADHQFTVVPMIEDNLRQVIEEPARQVGLKVEPELVEAILEDVRNQPGAMPLLEHALYEVWQQRHESTLTLAAYRGIGGVKGALKKRVEELYESLNQLEQETIQHVMLRLTQPGEGTEDTRRRVLMNELITSSEDTDLVNEVVRKFTDARLLTTSGGTKASGQVVDVSHEALIRDWPRLKKWIDDDRAGLRTLRRLNEAAQEWEREGRDNGFLYRGARLAVALEWRARNESKLNPLEREFLDESAALNSREEEERETAQQRELESEKRSSTRLRYFLTGLGILFIAAVILFLVAYSQKQQALAESKKNQALLYVADMKAAFQAFERGDSTEVKRLLEVYLSPAKANLRRFEWFWLWRIYHNEKAELVVPTSFFPAIAFLPDGKTLAVAASQGTVKLWDTQTQQEVGTLKADNEEILAIAVSPDGKTLATSIDKTVGTFDVIGHVRLWDLQSKRELATLKGHFRWGGSVAFSPDSKTLATVSNYKTVKLWDVQSKQELASIEGHQNAIEMVAFSPDGKTLAVAAIQGDVKLWDVQSRQELATFQGHASKVNVVAFSPDGKTLATASWDHTVKLWDVQSRRELATLERNKDIVASLTFSPDGKTLATASWDHTVKLWDVQSRQELVTIRGHTEQVWSVAFSPDGKTLATASRDHTVKLWDVQIQQEPTTLSGHTLKSVSVAFSPDSKMLASSSEDETVKLWDVQSNQVLATLDKHSGRVSSVAFSPDGKTLATASWDHTVKLWDVQSKQELATLEGHAYIDIHSVAFSPDGKTLASGGNDSAITLWDIQSKRELAVLSGHSREVFSVAFSPDGKTLASASKDNTVKLWDVQSRQELATLKGHTEGILSVAFSPDGKTLASASDDNTVKLWDVQSRQELATLKGHAEYVWSVAFSPDGRTLATASWDHTVKLWDVQSRQELVTLKGLIERANAVAFSPDGKTLATASDDKTVKLWKGASIK